MPQIEKAVMKMMRSLRGLSDVSQKHAIEMFVASWIDANFSEMRDVVSFTEHLKQQIDLYIADTRADGGRQH